MACRHLVAVSDNGLDRTYYLSLVCNNDREEFSSVATYFNIFYNIYLSIHETQLQVQQVTNVNMLVDIDNLNKLETLAYIRIIDALVQ